MFNFDGFDKEFAAAIKIGDIFHEIARTIPHLYAEDRRREGPNPYHERTAQGLMLEFYYGTPNKVWTPWGYYGYCGTSGGSHEEFELLKARLFERVKTRLFKEEEWTSNGVYGPYHVVLSVDDIELPEPSKLSGFEKGFYDASKADWAKRIGTL